MKYFFLSIAHGHLLALVTPHQYYCCNLSTDCSASHLSRLQFIKASHAYLPLTSHHSPVEKLSVTPHWLPDRIRNHDLRLQGHYTVASINISNCLPKTTHISKLCVLFSCILHLTISMTILRQFPYGN